MEYKPTIGLEIHVELKTKTKMFCSCLNDPEAKEPNVNICPVCTGHPGTLPVINKEAVRHILRVGASLKGELADFTEFDRKNYFYPDIPKGYQISQYKFPLVSGGELAGVKITRVHLEEDTAKSIHDPKTGESLVDFNRSSLPLMELVTEPVIHDGKTASNFAKELQTLLRYLGASEANMERGQMRLEANISVSATDELGTKVEVKNLNSFKSVERAIDFEIKRQTEVLESGGHITQETRGWDENKEVTFSQRKKESSHDYRYFPDPDLPKLFVSEIKDFEGIAKTLPELPWERREKYLSTYGLKAEDVESFVQDDKLTLFFEEVVKNLNEDKALIQLASNYTTSDVIGYVANTEGAGLPDSGHFAELVKMIGANELSSRGAKETLAVMLKEGGEPRKIAEAKGLFQVSDEGAIKSIVEKILSENPTVVAELKGGKEKSLQFLIGQGMKESKGSANPELLKKLIVEATR